MGVSNYSAEQTLQAWSLLHEMGVPLTVHQPRYNMLDRWIEKGQPSLCQVLLDKGSGAVAFSPLSQGVLSDRYLNGIPANSRAAGASVFLRPEQLTDELLGKVRALHRVAQERGETMA